MLSVRHSNHPPREIVTVYFSGTSHHIDDLEHLGGFLCSNTTTKTGHHVFGISGTLITNGISGLLFGTGIHERCQEIKNNILAILKQGKKVTLNCYGHSRGAIAALLLTKSLNIFSEDILQINLALFDAVPGNFFITQKMVGHKITLANQAMDLSTCHNLKKVLALYTNIPLADTEAHAPLMPIYPAETSLEEDVTPGCHSSAQLLDVDTQLGTVKFIDAASFITFSRITSFLESCGTEIPLHSWKFYDSLSPRVSILNVKDTAILKKRYDSISTSLQTREAHSYRTVKILTRPAQYLNQEHKKISLEVNASQEEESKQHTASLPYEYSTISLQEPLLPSTSKQDENEFAFSIEPPRSPRQLQNSSPENMVAQADLLKKFILQLFNSLTTQSKSSAKGSTFNNLIQKVNAESFTSVQSLRNALRNILALVLQRDKNRYSLFSTTQSGMAAKELLRSKEYASFAKIILGKATHKMRYRDLRMFVLGENKVNFFNAKSRQSIYTILNEKVDADNTVKLLTKTNT